MINIRIPGFEDEELHLRHLVLDFNGTLAIGGKLREGLHESLKSVSKKLQLHILTGNTFGTAKVELDGIPCKLLLLEERDQCGKKGRYVTRLGKDSVISIGNGRNDRLMLRHSAIGILVVQSEGASSESLVSSSIICTSIFDALKMINEPKRIVATLRQ